MQPRPGAAARAAPPPPIEQPVARAEPSVWGLVGNTPLVPLPLPRLGGRAPVLLKAEWQNPSGSVKDRAAREILRAGLHAGVLPGRRLLDASSGNTAVGYALLGAAAGIGVTVCIPANASIERRRLLSVFGAELIETDPLEAADGAIRRARELAEREPDRFWYADQYGNPANPRAHYLTTGPEIWRDTGGAVTHLVAGVGTSGTLLGTGRFLKDKRPEVRLIAVQPDGPFHGLEGLKRMDAAIVPSIYDESLIDETLFVSTEEAEAAVRELATTQGLFVGWSSGAAVAAARRLTQRGIVGPGGSDPVVVLIAPDGGQRYLSELHRLLDR
ncbi:MAG: PLP-dependent cysteine synthase family protein [Gemmatimonadetes bacterium]|nr:PLP-dependent cysteine synthase family protein [Gemmatimonadota bacterium]